MENNDRDKFIYSGQKEKLGLRLLQAVTEVRSTTDGAVPPAKVAEIARRHSVSVNTLLQWTDKHAA